MATERTRRRRSSAADVQDFIVDFRKEVKGTGGRIRVKAGTYRVAILGAKPVVSSEKQTVGLQVTFVFKDGKLKGKKLNESLWASPKALSRFRTLLEACGKRVPQRIELAKIARAIKGSELYIEVEDDKQKGFATRSRVTFEGFINPDDYDPDEADDDDDDIDEDDDDDTDDDDTDDDDDDDDDEEDDEDDDEEDEEEAPKRRSRSRAKSSSRGKSKSRKSRDDDDEDEDDDDDMDLDDY